MPEQVATMGDRPTLLGNGVETSDTGVFEQVLRDLLDTKTDTGEVGAGVGLYPQLFAYSIGEQSIDSRPLISAPVAWENGDQPPSFCAIGAGMEMEAVDPEPPSLIAATANGEGEAPAPDFPTLLMGQGNHAPSQVAQAVESGITIPSGDFRAGWEGARESRLLDSDFFNEHGMAVEPRQPPSPSRAEAQGDALPVFTARHGEMPLAPETRRAELFSTRFVDSVRAEPKPHARFEQAVPDQNPAPVHLATVFTHHVGATKVAETLQTATATPLAEPNWRVVEQLAHHIERMVYERERGSLTLRLDPPELGVIELRVQTSGNEVQAWVNAERDLTRQMLQQTQQQLREQLEARGLQLTHFDIGGQTNPHYAQARSYRTPATQSASIPHPSTATDSLLHDGRWSVWV